MTSLSNDPVEPAAGGHTPERAAAGAKRKRPAPLSIRLSDKERRKLETLAGDQPLGSFIKSRMFLENGPHGAPNAVSRYEMLARLLAALGESEVFANLNVIAKAVQFGDLKLTDVQARQISAACLLVLEMRNDLIRALGLKPPPIDRRGSS